MNENFIKSVFETAQIHVDRMQFAMETLQGKLPITAAQVEKFSYEDLMLWELLTNRFAKLQDLLGNKIFNIFLEKSGEDVDSWTMIDKINKLEKLGIIESAEHWNNMRMLRNHLAHEYPDDPEMTALYLNQAAASSVELITVFHRVHDALGRLL
jgi:hypothetical protein